MSDAEQIAYRERLDTASCAIMAIRPDLRQDMNLDEWLIEYIGVLTATEYGLVISMLANYSEFGGKG